MTENDYDRIFSVIIDNEVYDEIKILIDKKMKNYQKVIDLYTNKGTKIENKKENLFKYINSLLKEETNRQLFFKNLILLGELSIENLFNVTKFFSDNEKIKMIEKLSPNPKIQLEYLEKIINEIINLNEVYIFYYNEDFIDMIMKLYIELLCIHRKEKILPFLKTNDLYGCQEIIFICEKYEVSNDALLFLYKKCNEEYYLYKVKNMLEKNLKVLSENDLRENDFNSKLNDISKIFDILTTNFAIKTKNIRLFHKLQNIRFQDSDKDCEFWFNLLDFLYKYEQNLKTKAKISDNNRKSILIEFTLRKKNHLFELMKEYYNLNKILEILYYFPNKLLQYKFYLLKMVEKPLEQRHNLCCEKGLHIISYCIICKKEIKDKERIIFFFVGISCMNCVIIVQNKAVHYVITINKIIFFMRIISIILLPIKLKTVLIRKI